ncbi:tripartite tricarboxylate transporter TctB family protein [uncultured Jannaschia sp.]|uniref:tripartite tricarboxylate transporter TctB family protein n=1 Tax=uncultured Jannaschia sp. TaxID=293347 RepID=UPI00260CDE2F|nr:tripartite tricarboxylate transporter TctB family protein [uncultured Jannaschia sp.]
MAGTIRENQPAAEREARASGWRRFVPTLLPAGLLILALILPARMFSRGQSADVVGLGPAAWPGAMLLALAVLSAIWVARDLWALRRPGGQPLLTPVVEEGPYAMGKAVAGLVMIVVYGWLLSVIGFALASALFIAGWCVFGGVRNPLVLVPVTLIGTVALLWLFMGLALMPLPRGQGVFDGFSIWLLQTTGIY